MNKRYELEITATIRELPAGHLNQVVQIASAIDISDTWRGIERIELEARNYIINSICERLQFDSDLLVKWENLEDGDRNLLTGRLSIVVPDGHDPKDLVAISQWRIGL